MPIEELFVYFLVYALASRGAINAWLNGSIFAGLRARIEASADCFPRLAELAGCSFCLAYQVPFWLTVLFFLPGYFLPSPWGLLWQTPVLALAIAPFVLAAEKVGL